MNSAAAASLWFIPEILVAFSFLGCCVIRKGLINHSEVFNRALIYALGQQGETKKTTEIQ